jgi:hypothetical protein
MVRLNEMIGPADVVSVEDGADVGTGIGERAVDF